MCLIKTSTKMFPRSKFKIYFVNHQADLSGIKWRRLTVQTDTSNNGEPLEDAVLTSYSKCLQADLLCVWRRQPKGGGAKGLVDHSVASHKELWLFWYGDEPLSLQNYLSPDLYGDCLILNLSGIFCDIIF